MSRIVTVMVCAVCAGLMVASAAAQTAASAPVPAKIEVVDSTGEIEISISKLLKEKLNLESSLKLVNDDTEDLRLHLSFVENQAEGIPRLLILIDTVILARDKGGNVTSQSISMAAAADLAFPEGKIAKLLQWANVWNSRIVPIRVFVSGNRLFTATSVLTTKLEPVSADRVMGSFLGIVRAWPAVVRRLKADGLIEK